MAATQDIKTPSMGGEDATFPQLMSFPVAANVLLLGGTYAATDATGYAVPVTASSALRLWGRVERRVDNRTSNVPFGAAGDQHVQVKPGVYYFTNATGAGALSIANRGEYVFAPDNNTASALDGGGTYPIAGYLVDVGATGTPEAGKVAVAVGMARPEGLAASSASAFTARAVATSIAAYAGTTTATLTASANGALGTQDGVATLAVGDVIVLPRGRTNVENEDVGPWQIVSLGGGSAKYQLKRPAWWRHGGAVVQGAVIQIGGEGTLFGGSAFKSFAAPSQVIGTHDPVLWPNKVATQVTFVAGASGTIASIPIRSAAKSDVVITNSGTAAHASTRVWRPTTLTAGNLGTAALVVSAQSAPGTANTDDVGVYTISVINW